MPERVGPREGRALAHREAQLLARGSDRATPTLIVKERRRRSCAQEGHAPRGPRPERATPSHINKEQPQRTVGHDESSAAPTGPRPLSSRKEGHASRGPRPSTSIKSSCSAESVAT